MARTSSSLLLSLFITVGCLAKRRRSFEPANSETSATILIHQETLDFLDRDERYQIADTILIRTGSRGLGVAATFPRLAETFDDLATAQRYLPIQFALKGGAAISHGRGGYTSGVTAWVESAELGLDGFLKAPGLYPFKGFWDTRNEILEVERLTRQFPEDVRRAARPSSERLPELPELGRLQKQIEELERLARARAAAQQTVAEDLQKLEKAREKEANELQKLRNPSKADEDESLVAEGLRTDEELQAIRERLIQARQANLDRIEQEITSTRSEVAEIERQAKIAEETGVIAQLQVKADQIKEVWEQSGRWAAIKHLASFLGEGYKSGPSAKSWHNITTMPMDALSALSAGSTPAMVRVVAEITYNSDAMWHVVKGSERLTGTGGGQAFEAAVSHLSDIPPSSRLYDQAQELLGHIEQAENALKAIDATKVRATDSVETLKARGDEVRRVNHQVATILFQLSNRRLLGEKSLVANRGFLGTIAEASRSLMKRLQIPKSLQRSL